MGSAEFEGESPSPDRLPTCLTCATSPARPAHTRASYLHAVVWLSVSCLPTSFRRIVATSRPVLSPSPPLPSQYPSASAVSTYCTPVHPRPPREPGRSRGFQLPSASPSPFLILSTPPLERGTLRRTHLVQPTLIRVQSNPIRSSQPSPVQSKSNPAQSKSTTDTVQVQGQDYLEQIPPLLPASPLVRRSPLARPSDLAPGALYLIRLCSCLLHPSFLFHRSTASVSVLFCRLLSSLFSYLQACSPACLVDCRPVISRLSHQPISPSHSLAAAATLLLSRIDNTGLLTSTTPAPIHQHPPICLFCLPDQTSQPCQTLHDLSAAILELATCYCVVSVLSCDTSGRGESTSS